MCSRLSSSQQGSCFSVKKQTFLAIYLSSTGSNTSLTSLMMLGRYFKAAPCKKNTEGIFSCQAGQTQNFLLDPRKKRLMLGSWTGNWTQTLSQWRRKLMLLYTISQDLFPEKSRDTAFCPHHPRATVHLEFSFLPKEAVKNLDISLTKLP